MDGFHFTDAELRFCRVPLVYIAGPYTSQPVVGTHNAIQTCQRLNASGLVVAFAPHMSLIHQLVSPNGEAGDESYWYALDLAFLARCDALLRIPGESSGADREITFAVKNGISVFTEESALLRHAHQLPTRGGRPQGFWPERPEELDRD